MSVNPDDMILLAEVAEARSFTAAAARLSLPKSTVSQRISQLEERIGLRLLNRSTRQVSLTRAGEVFLEHCRRIRAETAAATRAMGHMRDQPEGALRLTCPEVTASFFMPGFLQSFCETYPRISLQLIATNRPLDLLREQIDFAFRVGAVSDQNFTTRRLSGISRILVAAPGYCAHAPVLRDPGGLSQQRCLVQEGHGDWSFSRAGQEISLQVPAVITSDSMSFLLNSALAGAGIALLPAYICQTALEADLLQPVLTDWQISAHEMMLVSPGNRQQSSAQAAFRKFVQNYDFSPLSGKR